MLRACATILLVAEWFAVGCSQGPEAAAEKVQLDFALVAEVHPALEVAPGQTVYPRDCVKNPLDQTVEYSYPSGEPQEFFVDRDVQLRLESTPLNLILTEYDAGIGEPFVVARVLLPPEDLDEAIQFRERYRRCTILVSVNDVPVWVDQNASRWDGAVPAGAYRSKEDAQSRLGTPAMATVWQEWPSLKRSERFWRWRHAMDLWEYACKEEVRRSVDAAKPEAAELLRSKLKGIDCSAPPTMEK